MSDLPEDEPLSIPRIVAAKGREKISMLTVYDAPSARLLDEAGIDILLVGDSVEMTVYGEPNTLSATMDEMIRHSRAVARAAKRAVVVGDMPFLSYQADPARAVENAGRFLAEARLRRGQGRGRPADPPGRRGDPRGGHPGHGPRGADAAVLPQVRRIQGAGPRGRLGARDPRGRPGARRGRLLRDRPRVRAGVARRRDHAGDRRSRRSASAPAPHCDGQVLVFHDVVGLTRDLRPKFVRRYADLTTVIGDAARAFRKDVKERLVPVAGGVVQRSAAGAPARALSDARARGTACDEHRLATSRPLRAAVGAGAGGRASRSRFVPTMGALHDGHLSLVRLARRQAPFVVVSIFVNPLQFGPERGLLPLSPPRRRGCAPPRARGRRRALPAGRRGALYPPDFSTHVEVGGVSEGGEGARRPGHFRGVATVVTKLFLQVLPDVAVFGRKDLQQVAVVRRLIRDLDFPIRLVVGDTVREPDGLAMSSRNAYLSPEDRRRAADLSRTLLRRPGARAEHGARDARTLEADALSQLEAAGLARRLRRGRRRRRPWPGPPTSARASPSPPPCGWGRRG